MAGLRIHHPTEKSCTVLVPHPGNADGRKPKDYYITLDGNGDAIVSETVWRRLEEARAAGWPHRLTVSNVVGAPPKQRIDLDKRRQLRPTLRIARG